jgi:hypothetical protein
VGRSCCSAVPSDEQINQNQKLPSSHPSPRANIKKYYSKNRNLDDDGLFGDGLELGLPILLYISLESELEKK